MRNTLNLVRGAVSTKDLLPVLTHFHIYEGRVQGGNGRIAIDAPCPELADFDCTVPAERFLKAVDACDGEPKCKLTEEGKLIISKGKFRATLPLAAHASFPKAVFGEGKRVKLPPVLAALRKLLPYIGEDASRPWSCGVLFRDGYAWATNNVVLARVPIQNLPDAVVPIFAIEEMVRMGLEPLTVLDSENALSFDLGEDRWLKVQKLSGDWPDVLKFIPAKPPEEGQLAQPLRKAIEKVLPFCPDPKLPVVQTGKDGVSTLEGESCAVLGMKELPETRFRAEPLLAVLGTASYIDLSTYPAACYWRGEGIDGVIVGMRS